MEKQLIVNIDERLHQKLKLDALKNQITLKELVTKKLRCDCPVCQVAYVTRRGKTDAEMEKV